MKRTLLAFAAALLLASCAKPTPYQAATDGFGYAEQQVEANRYRVRFSGNSDTPRQTVENYLLYRAAEITLQNGRDYFVMANERTERDTTYQQNFAAYPGYGYYRFWYPPAVAPVGASTPSNRYEAYADVVIFSGEKPVRDVQAFDARDVMSKLGPTIVRPAAK